MTIRNGDLVDNPSELDVVAPPESRPTEGEPHAVSNVPLNEVQSRHHLHGAMQSLQSLLTMLVIALFILAFVAQPFRIPSGSMEPTLLIGDFLLVEKQVGVEARPQIFASLGEVRRGDIVIFHYPVDPSIDLVKRVIGLPGDRIHLHEGRVYVNGRAIDEPYTIYIPAPDNSYRDEFPRMDRADSGVDAHWWAEMRASIAHGEISVPPNSYFVLGDNRNDSEDSRYWGFVPRANIVGKPLLIYFSLNDGRDQAASATAAGPSAVSAMPGSIVRGEAPSPSLLNFARWERIFRVVR